MVNHRHPAARSVILAGASAAILTGAAPTRADTLPGVLAHVYETNPTITGGRAGLRALDEGVPIARAAGRPTVAANAGYDEFLRQPLNRTLPTPPVTGSVSAEVPIFSGGLVRHTVRAAEARRAAGQSELLSTEANVFTETVAAYLDVIQNQSVLHLNENNVRVLETNVMAAELRFRAGELTRTDIAQSQARLEQARGQFASAAAQLAESHQEYLRVSGKAPDGLEPPPPLPELPATSDEAANVAVANNPALQATRLTRAAAGYDVRAAAAARYPRISAFATGDYSNHLGSSLAAGLENGSSQTVGVRVSVPLYQGGLPGARVREAQARESQVIEETTAVERAVIAQARSAHARYGASLLIIRANEQAVQANDVALEGVRAENSVGTRDVLDVLNAELELLNSRVALVAARRDSYVAGFALLAAVGRAEADDLGLDVQLYDPLVNFDRVRGKLSDWSQDPKPQPVATRTVDVQTAPFDVAGSSGANTGPKAPDTANGARPEEVIP